ncbi:MAG: glycosyltransferase [Acetobacteraceae bacterium]|nr:glycosyltransferase [Acetobacteraceae bacterium]MSP29076.1 glycosyltransferase [Acetobacteraceae bacterium]
MSLTRTDQIPTVLQILPALGTGGVERGTVEMTQAIADAGWHALVASAGGPRAGQVERAGGRHITLPLNSRNPITIWRNIFRLAALIRAEGVDIVHARSRAPAWSAWLAARRAGKKFVTTYHGTYAEDFPLKRRYNAVMARGDRVIAVSRYIAELVGKRHGVGAARIRVIPRGVDPALFDPAAVTGDRMARLARAWRLPDGAPVIMLPGRLTGWKGQTVLLDAMEKLDRKDTICVLLGGGRPATIKALTAHAQRLGIAERIRLPGDCEDMPAALMLADVVVSASTAPEAFGRVVIEAQAMARPTIATDHGGAVETINHDDTGWRIRPNDPAALAEAITYVLALTPEDRQVLGAQARNWVSLYYTTAHMQAATMDVYRELLEP